MRNMNFTMLKFEIRNVPFNAISDFIDNELNAYRPFIIIRPGLSPFAYVSF